MVPNMSLMTKKVLASSLKGLMKKKPLKKITIKDIVSDCDVNRQTFYYHFQDIYDLVDWIYKTEVIDNISEYKTYKKWKEGFLGIFHYIEDNESFCMNTLDSLGKDHLANFLYNNTFDLLISVVNEISEGMDVLDEDKEFIANFYTYAFVSLVIMWMKDGMKESPEGIVGKLNRLIDGDIERCLKKYR